MKRLIMVAVMVMMAGQAWGDTLCAGDEKKMFACKLEKSNKSVSICQSKTDPKQVYYKFGTPDKIEMVLPKGKSGQPYLVHEQFGSSSSQWSESINFPSGKAVYSLVTPQGMSVQLTVEGIKKPISMSCEYGGDSGPELTDAYIEMERLKFKVKQM